MNWEINFALKDEILLHNDASHTTFKFDVAGSHGTGKGSSTICEEFFRPVTIRMTIYFVSYNIPCLIIGSSNKQSGHRNRTFMMEYIIYLRLNGIESQEKMLRWLNMFFYEENILP